jgi:hypothetical protein
MDERSTSLWAGERWRNVGGLKENGGGQNLRRIHIISHDSPGRQGNARYNNMHPGNDNAGNHSNEQSPILNLSRS